jgi:hypothetical protein
MEGYARVHLVNRFDRAHSQQNGGVVVSCVRAKQAPANDHPFAEKLLSLLINRGLDDHLNYANILLRWI